MGNKNLQNITQIDDDEWEIVIDHPKSLSIKKPIVQVYEDQSVCILSHIPKQNTTLFEANLKIVENKQKKYKISKRILELQNQIGGEQLFGIIPGKGPINFQPENPKTQETLTQIYDRPVLQRRKQRETKNNLQLLS